jgi:hypothetical protein
MSLITKEHLSLTIQALKKLLSLKPNKEEVFLKSEMISDEEFLNWLSDENIVSPLATASGEIYIANNNEIYVL